MSRVSLLSLVVDLFNCVQRQHKCALLKLALKGYHNILLSPHSDSFTAAVGDFFFFTGNLSKSRG